MSILNDTKKKIEPDTPDELAVIARPKQYTTPAFSERLRKTTESLTAIHVGVNSITWAQLKLVENRQTLLTHWSFHEISDKKLHLNELVDRVFQISNEIPQSDIYIFENPRVAQQGPQGTPAQININVQLSQTVAMIAIAMQSRFQLQNKNTEKESKAKEPLDLKQVLFLRQFLASR